MTTSHNEFVQDRQGGRSGVRAGVRCCTEQALSARAADEEVPAAVWVCKMLRQSSIPGWRGRSRVVFVHVPCCAVPPLRVRPPAHPTAARARAQRQKLQHAEHDMSACYPFDAHAPTQATNACACKRTSADGICRQRTQMVNRMARTRQIAAHTQPAMAYVKLPCSTMTLAELQPWPERMHGIHPQSGKSRFHVMSLLPAFQPERINSENACMAWL
jgi:hypothetical protein